MDTGRIQGKIALVTGSGSGIGREIALLFAEEGAVVVASDIDQAAAQEVADVIQSRGGTAAYFKQDVTEELVWKDIMSNIQSEYGNLDILVNNAGVTELGTVESISLDDWRKVTQVNLESVFLGTRAGIEMMKDSGGGSIVNISSIEGLIGDPDLSAYTASKGGVRVFSKSAALYCAREKYNIRVNSVHPGVIKTRLLENHLDLAEDSEAILAELVGKHPIGFLGEGRDVAYGVLYLSSDESRFVTGSELVIDGGYTAQ